MMQAPPLISSSETGWRVAEMRCALSWRAIFYPEEEEESRGGVLGGGVRGERPLVSENIINLYRKLGRKLTYLHCIKSYFHLRVIHLYKTGSFFLRHLALFSVFFYIRKN